MRKLRYPPVYVGIYALLLSATLASVQLDSNVADLVAAAIFWAVVFAVTLMGGLAYGKRESKVLLTLSNNLVAFSVLVLLATYYTSGLSKAFVYFLIVIQAARNLTLATRRDLYFACLTSFILILYPASVSKQSGFAVYVVAYVLAMMFTFMADHIDECLSRAQGGDKATLSHGINFPFNVGLVSAAVIGVALTVYLFLPRPPMLGTQAFPAGGGTYYHNSDWEREARSGKTEEGQDEGEAGAQSGADVGEQQPAKEDQYGGFSDQFDIMHPGSSGSGSGRQGNSAILNGIVFYLQADRPLYVRGKSFDSFDGRVWRETAGGRRKIASDDNTFEIEKTTTHETVAQIYTINRHLPDVILAAYQPVLLRFPARAIETGRDFSLRAPRELAKDTVYSVKSQTRYVGLRPSGPSRPFEGRERYLALPEDLSPRVIELSQSVTKNFADDLQRAEALENYLRATYQYTLATVGQEPPPHLVENFLFETKAGHCEIFASTMTVMLRAIRIPARLVTGYVASTYNPITGYYEVRVLNAHAWVEALIKGYGWVTFEPTPPFALPQREPPRTTTASIMEYLKQKQEAESLANAKDWSASATQVALEIWETLKAIVAGLKVLLKQTTLALWSWVKTYGLIVLLFVGTVAGVAFALYRSLAAGFLAAALDRFRLARARKLSPRRFILVCYRAAERALTRKGYPRPPSWTHREYENRLPEKLRRLRSQIGLLTTLFGLARYSRYPLHRKHAETAYTAYGAIATNTRGLDQRAGK